MKLRLKQMYIQRETSQNKWVPEKTTMAMVVVVELDCGVPPSRVGERKKKYNKAFDFVASEWVIRERSWDIYKFWRTKLEGCFWEIGIVKAKLSTDTDPGPRDRVQIYVVYYFLQRCIFNNAPVVFITLPTNPQFVKKCTFSDNQRSRF